MADVLYFVVPCYNEEEVLPLSSKAFFVKLDELIKSGKISNNSRVLFVDDGSTDNTWKIIEKLHEESSFACGIKLSKNKGHQNALLAGLFTAKKYADAVITLDADLQDDIEAADKMLEKYYNGSHIVYGVRSKRTSDTFFKRTTAHMFYTFASKMGIELQPDHADYRLMSRRVIEELERFGEVNLFLRGLVPMLGFETDIVYYERHERAAGKSKYPLGKMLSFAANGITSLSIKPIRFITSLGIFIFIISIIMLVYSVVQHYCGHTVSGWSSLIVSIWAIGGLQLLSIGIIGEYIGKIYLETKKRPRYIIEKNLGNEEHTA